MYKPKPDQRNTNRLRLDIESKIPSLYAVEAQLNEAKGRRGCLVELPWQGNKPMQLWILGVEWQANGDGPIWSLYEQYGNDSKQHWANPYAPGDIPIMYDVVCMSTMGDPIMKPAPEPPPPPPPPPPPEPVPAQAPPPTYYQPMPGMPYPMPGYPMDANGMPYPPMDPNLAQQYGYNPYYPGQPYPGVPPPGWPYPPQGQGAPYPPQPQGAPYPPQPQAPMPAPLPPEPAPPPPPAAPAKMQIDYNLVSKRAKVQLGKLLLESTLISETTLDAALKLQTLVEEGLCTPDLAAKGLFKFHTKGQAIGEYLTDFDAVVLPPVQKRLGGKVDANAVRSHSSGQAKAAFDLLIKAGLLTDADINAAAAARAKVGGDMAQLLQSAGKLDKITFESAVTCLPMIREGFLKLEQCIIALNYCNRSRVDFDTALDEMGWQNPRKLRKDLFQ
jgi:hypothetical protein